MSIGKILYWHTLDRAGEGMADATIIKTICQHSRHLPADTMAFLRGIAEDYAKVRAATYERYGGIRSLNHLTPAYNILSEMRSCGLRSRLDLPSAYYELAVMEAVTDIKSMWGTVKNKVREAISSRDWLTSDERKYLRTVLRIDTVFAAVLNRRKYEMPRNMEGISVETGRLNNLICRLVRQCHMKPAVRKADYFRVTPAGYCYKDGGIYLVSRIKRRRVFLPLKDEQVSSRQICVRLGSGEASLYIYRESEVKEIDGSGSVYAYIGYQDAVTLSNGHVYGAELGRLVSPETERLNAKNHERNRAVRSRLDSMKAGDMAKAERIRVSNLGKKKYDRQKQRARDRTQNFINAELNRLLEVEKPKRVVITKPIVRYRRRKYSPQANRRLARSFGSYIRKRLEEKCKLYGIEVLAINPKGTGSTCSACGSEGIREKQDFHCEHCGYAATIAQNTARNIERMAKGIV